MRLLVALLAMTVAATARAELVYEAADGCPDAAAVRAAVVRELGRDPFVDAAATCRIAADERGFRAVVSVGGEGARSFVAPTCAEAADAAAFAISVALGVDRSRRPRAEAGPADVDDEVPRLGVARRGAGWSLAAGGGLVAALGVVPEAGGGAVAGVEARRGPWSGAVELRLVLGAFDVEPGASVAVTRVGVPLTACRHVGRLAGCALLEPGVLVGTPSGFELPRSAAVPGLAAGGRALVEVGPVRATFDLTLELSRAELVADDRVVWAQPAVSATLGVGVFVRIP